MRDIVGGIIEGKTVTNNLSALKMAVSSGLNIRWLDKKHMQLMASFDLGANWVKLPFFINPKNNYSLCHLFPVCTEIK